ncbi:hypothetical protein FRC07_007297 [Ceratobasidium sp. 392]|nr:hypothetical protein FRC07_007297 [Ceratobasidium sp. 392]
MPAFSLQRCVEGLRIIRTAWESQGVDTATWDDLTDRLDPTHPLWNNQFPSPGRGSDDYKDPSSGTGIRGFHSIGLKKEVVPFGSWPQDEVQQTIGVLMRLLAGHTWRSLAALMTVMGTEENEAKAFVDEVMEEYAGIDKLRVWGRCHIWTARRI